MTNFDPIKLGDVGLSCATCFYWRPLGPPVKAGICQRQPPRATPPDCEPEWPLTGPNDVCGEWHTDTEPPAHLGLAEFVDIERPAGGTTCRVCGCTDERACEGGCTWVEDDLCSKCAIARRDAEYRLPPGATPKDATGCDV